MNGMRICRQGPEIVPERARDTIVIACVSICINVVDEKV